jgi:hypothetical protein
MAPRFVLALLGLAFGIAVVFATVTTVQQIKSPASALSATHSNPASLQSRVCQAARHQSFGV